MKKTTTIIAASVIALSLTAVNAFAAHGDYRDEHRVAGFDQAQNYNRGINGPRGFNNEQFRSIKEIINNANDDEMVFVQGRLTRFLGDDKYELTDANNDRIVLELDDDRDWSYISKDQPIEVVAKVDKDLLSTKLDIKNARPLPPKPPKPMGDAPKPPKP